MEPLLTLYIVMRSGFLNHRIKKSPDEYRIGHLTKVRNGSINNHIMHTKQIGNKQFDFTDGQKGVDIYYEDFDKGEICAQADAGSGDE